MVAIMKSMNIILVFCVLSGFQLYGSVLSCNVPSRFWCDNAKVAMECDVYEQCKKNVWSVRLDADPVEFDLYYESLCPDCKRFISQMLYPTFTKIGSIMNITLVPYGNAKEMYKDGKWEFTCQHGKEECEGNLIETCTISLVKNISVYLPFINCMESSSSLPKTAAVQCAEKFPVPVDQIFNCTATLQGNKWEHEMAEKTDALNPPHQYVPWVTLNGVHTEKIEQEAETNLLKLICDTYKGTKPPACPQ